MRRPEGLRPELWLVVMRREKEVTIFCRDPYDGKTHGTEGKLSGEVFQVIGVIIVILFAVANIV